MRPLAEQPHEEVALPAARQHLRDDHQVGDQRGDDDDGRVAGVEQLDRVQALLPAVLRVLHRQLHAEALEVDHHEEHDHGRQQVGDVGQAGAVERIAQRADLVLARDQQVEQRDDRALELLAAAVVHRHRRERAPHHRLADVRRDEQRDARAQAVALLQQLVQQQHDDAREGQLHDDQRAREPAQLARRTVHARHHVYEGRRDGQDDAEQLLHALEQLALLLHALVEHHQLQARQQLHNHARGHNGADTQLHQRTTMELGEGRGDEPVGASDGAKPVERIGGGGVGNAVQGNLAAHQIDEQRDDSPQATLTEGNLVVSALGETVHLLLGVLHFGEESTEGFADMEEID